MSQAGAFGSGGGGVGDIVTLTGNTGGAVGPDGSGNINFVGDGTTATVVGNNGTHTLTISSIPGSAAVTYVNTSPYVVLTSDYFLDVDCSSGAITIQLPDTAAEGQSFIIKDLTGNAATNNITVTTVSGSTTIDNSASYTIATNYFSMQVTGNSQSAYDIALDYNPGSGGGITEIAADIGSATGSTITFTANSPSFAGSSVTFQGGGASMYLVVNDLNNNVIVGGGSSINSGNLNTGFGYSVFSSLASGSEKNIAIGSACLEDLNLSSNNVGIGSGSLSGLSTGSGGNIGIGSNSLASLADGVNNVGLGSAAGNQYTLNESNNIVIGNGTNGVNGESNVLRIGNATGSSDYELSAAYICGIASIGVTGSPVLVSSSDQLGVSVSSARFKKDIQNMDQASEALYNLRPVTFVWNKESTPGLKDCSSERQFGLIAEEAYEHIPHAVNLDKEGRPFNINYHDLISMHINETQKLSKRIYALELIIEKIAHNNTIGNDLVEKG